MLRSIVVPMFATFFVEMQREKQKSPDFNLKTPNSRLQIAMEGMQKPLEAKRMC